MGCRCVRNYLWAQGFGQSGPQNCWAGIYFNSEDFLRPEAGTDTLTSVDNERGDDRGNDWTACWKGFIEGPFTGEAADGLRFKIGDSLVINGFSETGARPFGKTGFLSSLFPA
ncbi:MAG: PA14 domain-containing protein [Planctomycetota bacterium]